MKIYKYTLTSHSCSIPLPVGSKVISAGIQGNSIVIWALVDPNRDNTPYYFRSFNTGEDLSSVNMDDYGFIGTVTSINGIVWHVFVRW